MQSLVDIMTQASAELSASIASARISFSHNLTKGEAVEAVLRQFLRKHLPDSIGIAHGQVVDRHGQMSKQLDIILYDARRTPILFTDASGENRLLPVEGVIAVIECKTDLKQNDVAGIAESAALIKRMDRTAYYRPETTVIRTVKRAYGTQGEVLPILYFVFAFDGPLMNSVSTAVARSNGLRELHEGIDMVCVMNRGVVVNATFSANEEGQRMVQDVDCIASPNSQVMPYDTQHALLLFYILMCRFVLQGDVPPIAIQQYIPADFTY